MLNELKSLQDRADLRRTQAASARRAALELRMDDEVRLLAYADGLDQEADFLARRAETLQASH
jgi:hypothetical protein